jgi:hypothetical protein
MKIQLRELKFAEQALTKVFNMPFSNVKLAYSVMKISKKVLRELTDMEEVRIELIKKYGELDQEGNPVLEDNRFKLKDQKAFEAEWNELLDKEIDLDVWMLPFEAIQNAGFSIAQLSTIDKFIDEEKKIEIDSKKQKEEIEVLMPPQKEENNG